MYYTKIFYCYYHLLNTSITKMHGTNIFVSVLTIWFAGKNINTSSVKCFQYLTFFINVIAFIHYTKLGEWSQLTMKMSQSIQNKIKQTPSK